MPTTIQPGESRPIEKLRDDLKALRLDRSAPTPKQGLSSRTKAILGACVVLVVLLGGYFAYSATLGRVPEVRVAYAVRSAPGGAQASAVARTALTGSGYVVTATDYISLGVRVPGRIIAYKVEQGERVKKDQPLVELDARPFQTQLRRARAQLDVARANVELRTRELARLKELHEKQVASDAELDLKQNQLSVAEAEVARNRAEIAQIELDLEDTVLRSPVEGMVLERLKEVGEIATPGGFQGSGELIRIANLQEIRAEIDVNESELSKVFLGQQAQVVPDADSSRSYAAKVVELAPQINRQKGTLKVEVKILEPDAWLRPDMSARITFFEPARETDAPAGSDVVTAPAAAIHRDERGSFAWVVSQDHVRRQAVETASARGSDVAVLSGLLGGEALVVSDPAELDEGRSVRLVDPARP